MSAAPAMSPAIALAEPAKSTVAISRPGKKPSARPTSTGVKEIACGLALATRSLVAARAMRGAASAARPAAPRASASRRVRWVCGRFMAAGNVEKKRRAVSYRLSANPLTLSPAGRGCELSLQRGAAGKARVGAELVGDPEELVVFRQPVGARQRAGLDLPAIGR